MLKNKRIELSKLILVFILIIGIKSAIGQETCVDELDKKTNILLDEGKNRKYLMSEQIQYLKQALEHDEECLECKLQLGYIYFEKADRSGGNFSSAEKVFKALVQQCPEYHSDPWYYLGLFAYTRKDYEAANEAFDRYIHFPVDDPSKFSKNSDKMYDDVKEVMAEIEFYARFFGQPVPFEPRIVQRVSTRGDEYLPTISPDNSLIFFTRKFSKKAKGDLFEKVVEVFMWSEREDSQGIFPEGQALPAPFNLGDNYGGVSISVNNKELFVTVCSPRSDGYNDCDIFVTHWERQFDEKYGIIEWGWSPLENLGPGVNTNGGWEAQPSVTPDGKTLYFATARESSLNHSIDIYKSTKLEDGTWGQAEPVGGDINTMGNEKSPFIHADSKTLYFSSDGRLGGGGYDIFYTRYDSLNAWSKPVNIGYPINSEKDEHGLIVSTDGRAAYFSTNRLQGIGGYDIYRFNLPDAAKPEEVLLIKGEVLENDELDEETTKISIKNLQTEAIRNVEINQEDGSYATIVNVSNNDYLMQIEQENAAFEAYILTRVHSQSESIITRDIKPAPLKIGKSYVIHDINYETNQANIDQTSKWMLDAFADYLKRQPDLKVMILGHTDDVGDEMANYALSADRAFTVKEYLESKGVRPNRLDFKGFGENQPIESNTTEAGRALNRRTEFKIIEK